MKTSGQLHVPAALPPGKEPLIPIGYEAGWVPEPFWTRWWWKKSQPLPGYEPPIIQPVVQRCTTIAVSEVIHAHEKIPPEIITLSLFPVT
jgi:hypothetical protein